MRIPYKTQPGPRGTTLYYPLLRVRIGKKNGPQTRFFEALVDSGASDCMFHESLAVAIGIDPRSGEPQARVGIGGTPEQVWVHPVTLSIGEHVLNIRATFSKALPIAGLLGRSGFFEYFKITFDPTSEPPGIELERIRRA